MRLLALSLLLPGAVFAVAEVSDLHIARLADLTPDRCSTPAANRVFAGETATVLFSYKNTGVFTGTPSATLGVYILAGNSSTPFYSENVTARGSSGCAAVNVDFSASKLAPQSIGEGDIPWRIEVRNGIVPLAQTAFRISYRAGQIYEITSRASGVRSDLVGGAVFTIQGDGLAPGEQRIDALPLPEEVLGTRVFVDGKAAKLLWVAPTYIVFQAPWAMLSGFAEVYVRTAQGEGNRIRKRVSGASPGVSQDGGTASAEVYSPDGVFLGMAGVDTPVKPGYRIALFVTGLGACSNPPADGNVAGDESSVPVREVAAELGGVPLMPDRTFLSPRADALWTGYYLSSFMVPDSVPSGAKVTLRFWAGGRKANDTTLPVQVDRPLTAAPSISSNGKTSGAPGEVLILKGGGWLLGPSVMIRFSQSGGASFTVQAHSVTEDTIQVFVPPLLDNSGRLAFGDSQMELTQQTANGLARSNALPFRVLNFTTAARPGTALQAVLDVSAQLDRETEGVFRYRRIAQSRGDRDNALIDKFAAAPAVSQNWRTDLQSAQLSTPFVIVNGTQLNIDANWQSLIENLYMAPVWNRAYARAKRNLPPDPADRDRVCFDPYQMQLVDLASGSAPSRYATQKDCLRKLLPKVKPNASASLSSLARPAARSGSVRASLRDYPEFQREFQGIAGEIRQDLEWAKFVLIPLKLAQRDYQGAALQVIGTQLSLDQLIKDTSHRMLSLAAMLSLFEEDLEEDFKQDTLNPLQRILYGSLRDYLAEQIDKSIFDDFFGDSKLTGVSRLYEHARQLASILNDLRYELFSSLDDFTNGDIVAGNFGNVLIPEQPHQARPVQVSIPGVPAGSSGSIAASLCSNAIGLRLGSGPTQWSVNLTAQSTTAGVSADGVALLRFPIDAVARTGSSSCEVDALNTATGTFLGSATVRLDGGSNGGGCRLCNDASSACPAC